MERSQRCAATPALARDWVPRLLTREYDSRDIPFEKKRGGLIGMGMTEKQGGSDVRANTTRAVRSSDGSYRITGHKWFFSAPQCDAHLVLAQSSGGLSCFFMPRRLPDGSLNGIYIQRLKDKLGNRSNASSEVEFVDAWATLLGEEGRGVPTILEMGTFTRLDCCTGSAGMMRQAVVQALHHAHHRKVFGSLLIEQPLMRSVLVDMALESEAAVRAEPAPGARIRQRHAERNCAAPRAHLRRQILGLQARLRIGGRSHGSVGRQRLHRGIAVGANGAGDAREFHLGRVRQHHVSRRAARLWKIAGDARGRTR